MGGEVEGEIQKGVINKLNANQVKIEDGKCPSAELCGIPMIV